MAKSQHLSHIIDASGRELFGFCVYYAFEVPFGQWVFVAGIVETYRDGLSIRLLFVIDVIDGGPPEFQFPQP